MHDRSQRHNHWCRCYKRRWCRRYRRCWYRCYKRYYPYWRYNRC